MITAVVGTLGLIACGSTGDEAGPTRLAGDETALDARSWVSEMCSVVQPSIGYLNSILDPGGTGGSLTSLTPDDDDAFGDDPTGDEALVAVQSVLDSLGTAIENLPPPGVPGGVGLSQEYPSALSAASTAIRTAFFAELRNTTATNTPDTLFDLVLTTSYVVVSAEALSAWQSLNSAVEQSLCADLIWIAD